ncbi:MAG: lytic transglycosylase domain-containing protein [Candidatus Micrarchaeota archaeon]|nr:lytic transglycosylase domain-containing protein [Candidatus Micrarchaeota archaeon]
MDGMKLREEKKRQFVDSPYQKINEFFEKTGREHVFDIKTYWEEKNPQRKYHRLVIINNEGKIFDYRLVANQKQNAKINWEKELNEPKNWLSGKEWERSFGKGFVFGEGNVGGAVISKVGSAAEKRERKATRETGKERLERSLGEGKMSKWVERQVSAGIGPILEKNKKYSKLIEGVCNRFDVPKEARPFVYAIMDVESEGKERAVHDKGNMLSYGLMQITDIAIKDFEDSTGIKITDKFDPRQNLMVGIWFFKNRCLAKFPSDPMGAVLAYNKGPNGAERMLKTSRTHTKEFKMAEEYVMRVFGMLDVFESLQGRPPDSNWAGNYLAGKKN